MITRPPSLAREIGQCAWMLTKVLAVCAVVIGLLAWVFSRNQTAGLIAFYVLCFSGMVVFYGWQSYKWKKKDWERERDRAGRMARAPFEKYRG